MAHVPFKGTGELVPALLGGHIEVLFSAYPSLSGAADGKQVRLLATNGAQRSAQAPDLPSLAEFIPGFDFAPVIGIFARTGTPPAVVQKIVAEALAVVSEPDLVRQLAVVGVEPAGVGPEGFASILQAEDATCRRGGSGRGHQAEIGRQPPRRWRGKRHAKAGTLRCHRRLRPRPPLDRRHGCHRWGRARVHDPRPGGDLLPGVPARRVRHCRIVALQLHGASGARRQPLRRRARVPVARLPAFRHLHPHRPRYPSAGRPRGPQGRACRISADRQRLDPRFPRRRFPSRAGVDPVGEGRHREVGTAGEDPDHAATWRERDGGAGRALVVGAAARRRDRCPDRPTHAFGDDAPPIRRSAGCSPIRAARRSRITGERRTFRSCI